MICPECGLTAKHATEAVDLPVNQLMVSTIQDLSPREVEELRQECGICEGKTTSEQQKDAASKASSARRKAVMLCEDCEEFMCEKCKRLHQELFKGKDKHDVVNLVEARRRAGGGGSSKIFRSLSRKSKTQKERCEDHKETLKLYCTFCEVPACLVCKITEHDGHLCINIDDAVEDHKDQIEEAIEDIESKLTQVQEAENVWMGYMGVLEHKEEHVKRDIEKYVNGLIAQIRKWQKQTVAAVESMCERERTFTNKNLSKVRQNKENLATIHTIAKHLNRGRKSHVLEMKDAVVERARNLDAVEVEKPQVAVQYRLRESIHVGQFVGDSIGVVTINERSEMFRRRKKRNSRDFLKSTDFLDTRESLTESTSTIILDHSMDAETSVYSGTIGTSFSIISSDDGDDSASCKITGLSLGRNDDIFVVDNFNTVIKRFSIHGQLQDTLQVKELLSAGVEKKKLIQNPLWDCAVLSDGDILIASAYGIHVLSNQGNQLDPIDTGCEYTSVVACNKTNKAVAYGNRDCRVVIFDLVSKTKVSSFVISLRYAVGTVGSVGSQQGNILVSDMHADRVKVYNPLGRKLFEIGKHGKENGSFLKPRGVCVDKHGNIYVADKGNHRIQSFSPKGKFQGVLLSRVDGLEAPVDVALAQTGNLVTITERGLVYVVTTDCQLS